MTLFKLHYGSIIIRTVHILQHDSEVTGSLTAKAIPLYIFLFWELRGLGPNFYIHGSSIVGIYNSLIDT
jgi:hypothetical protein